MFTTWPSAPGNPASLPLIVTSTAPALPIVTLINPESVKLSVAPLYNVPCQRTVPLLSVTENQLLAPTALKLTVDAVIGGVVEVVLAVGLAVGDGVVVRVVVGVAEDLGSGVEVATAEGVFECIWVEIAEAITMTRIIPTANADNFL